MGDDKSGIYAPIVTEVSLHENGRRKTSRIAGWRGTVTLGALAALFVLLINTAVLVWTVTQFSLQYGIATVFTGSCPEAARISTATHLVINILSSLLLAASNSGMQVLVAPTREEIDQAHAKRKWLDLGVHTLRNLASISKSRFLTWAILGLSSVPLHLVYNSVLFEIADGNGFIVFTVGKDFVTGGFWNQTREEACFGESGYYDYSSTIKNMQQNIESLKRIENAECIATFGSGVQSAYGNVLAVSSKSTQENLLNVVSVSFGGGGVANNWVCDVAGRGTTYCDLQSVKANAASWTLPGNSGNGTLVPYFNSGYYCDKFSPNEDFPISHCLVQPAEEHCKLGVSAIFLGIVVAFNALKMIFLIITAMKTKRRALVTVGDAVESFLDYPDSHTKGAGLLSRGNMEQWESRRPDRPTTWKPQAKRGFSAASPARWIICSLLFIAVWCLCLGLLAEGISTLNGTGIPTTFTYLRSLGFGKPIISEVLSLGSQSQTDLSTLPADVIVANLPQLVVSMLYLLYNDLFTRMHLSKEWTSYGQSRKPLRVTHPRGEQRSTYFLQLPFRYSIPLIATMIVLHWLISQSIFLTLINVYDYSEGSPPVDRGLATSGLGWSPYAIFFSLVIGGLMIVGLWAYAFLLRYPNKMPIVGSSSAAISAACHRLDWDLDAARRRVKWGVVSVDPTSNVGHAAFSSGEVEDLVQGMMYS